MPPPLGTAVPLHDWQPARAAAQQVLQLLLRWRQASCNFVAAVRRQSSRAAACDGVTRADALCWLTPWHNLASICSSGRSDETLHPETLDPRPSTLEAFLFLLPQLKKISSGKFHVAPFLKPNRAYGRGFYNSGIATLDDATTPL